MLCEPHMNAIERFLVAIDAAWPLPVAPQIELRILGSAALFLQCDYLRGTKDADVIETVQMGDDVQTALLALAGRGTPLHDHHRLYLDLLGARFPFLPPEPMWWPMEGLTARLTHFSVTALDPTDVLISKLPRFHAVDVQDIAAVIRRDLVYHPELVSRFQAAIDSFSMDSRSDDFLKYVARLHQVERDFFGVAESKIELPSWADAE